MRGIHCTFQKTFDKGSKDFDEESLASVSSEEIKREDDEDREDTDEMPNDMNKALDILFQSEEFQLLSIEESFLFMPPERKDIPKKLYSILDTFEIFLA